MDQIARIADMVREAERHADDMSKDRIRATEYYRGVMKDMPADDGKSGFVVREVRDRIKKALPSIMRTILGSEDVVEFQPVAMGDEDGAAQASDYINRIIMQECNGRKAIYDAVHDALLLRNGILRWWWEEKQVAKISSHTGLTDDALAILAGDDDVEVLEHSEVLDSIEGQPVTLHDVKIRRVITQRRVRIGAVPRERFLIDADATSIDDSNLTGVKEPVRRGDLIAMGFDRDVIDGLSVADDEDEGTERRDIFDGRTEVERANDPIDYYDLFIRVDMDGDGIAELRHMCFAGGLGEKNLLINDECDDVQLCDIKVMEQPHQWEGISLFDDLSDIQQAETELLRQTLNNIYWQNHPQPMFQSGVIENEDAVYNPEFGLPIRVRSGMDVRSAIGFTQVPFVARDSFGMLEYLDRQADDRSGINDASSGLAPDALQNMTAKASAMIEQGGIGQAEMMVGTIAAGLRTFFRGVLRLTIRHQDVPRMVRLRDDWVEFDPRHWNADMDCTVNTGLGAGTRERDMIVMQQVIGLQERLLAAFGPDNPFVKPENLYAALSKLVESAGLKTPSLYFTEPDPQEIAAKMQAQAQQPSPDQIKAEAEGAKAQAQMQLEQVKMQANRDKEMAQMEADLRVEQARIAADTERQRNELASRAALEEQKISWEREKFAAQMQFEREKLAQQRNDEILRAQASQIRSAMGVAQ